MSIRLPDISSDKKLILDGKVLVNGFQRGSYTNALKYLEVNKSAKFKLHKRNYRPIQCAILVAAKRLSRLGMKFTTHFEPEDDSISCWRVQ